MKIHILLLALVNIVHAAEPVQRPPMASPQEWANKLTSQPRKSATQWNEFINLIDIGMSRAQVNRILPQKTISIDYLYPGKTTQDTVHTSFYALDGKYAVAITYDFHGASYLENRLLARPKLLVHNCKPDKYNEINFNNVINAEQGAAANP